MKLTVICLSIIFLAACKKSDDPLKTVDDITLTTHQLDVPTNTYDTGPYPIQSVLVGNSIYFGNWSNTAKTQFFVRYDLSSNSFSSALSKSANVCGCGYRSHLVSDGTTIFYIANDATKYITSSNTWTIINYPGDAIDNAGEAGVVYYNGKIYFIGGRTPSTRFKYYSISQDKWFTLPTYLYSTTSSELAVYKDRIYVLGGQGAKRKMAYFSTTANTWTAVRDIPIEVSINPDNVFSAVLGNYLYLLQDQEIYIYDIVSDTWAIKPVILSGLPGNGNLFSNGERLYVSGKNSSNTPTIMELIVSTN